MFLELLVFLKYWNTFSFSYLCFTIMQEYFLVTSS